MFYFLSLYKGGDFTLVIYLLLFHSSVLTFLVAQPFLLVVAFFYLISLFHFLWLNCHYFAHFMLEKWDFQSLPHSHSQVFLEYIFPFVLSILVLITFLTLLWWLVSHIVEIFGKTLCLLFSLLLSLWFFFLIRPKRVGTNKFLCNRVNFKFYFWLTIWFIIKFYYIIIWMFIINFFLCY